MQEEKETLQSKLEIAHEELEKANQQSDVDEAVKVNSAAPHEGWSHWSESSCLSIAGDAI